MSQTSNQVHVSSSASIRARIVVLHPAPLLFSWQNSLSVELKAESVWHPGYIGASYQGVRGEECFWSTWPCTQSDDELVLSPSPHLPATNTLTHKRRRRSAVLQTYC